MSQTSPTTQKGYSDPLNIIPDIEWNTINILYTLSLIFAVLMMLYGFYLYFDAYESRFYPVTATVKEVDCNRFAVNNHSNEYHCVLGIEYPAYAGGPEQYKNSLTFVDNERFFEGDQIMIMVDKENPLKVRVQVMPDQTRAVLICILALLLVMMTTTVKFVEVD